MSSNRFAVAGAALAARKLKYVHVSETIIEERFGPEQIVRLFLASASKSAKTDCALIILAGSISECRAHRETWSPEPEARLAKELVARFRPRQRRGCEVRGKALVGDRGAGRRRVSVPSEPMTLNDQILFHQCQTGY